MNGAGGDLHDLRFVGARLAVQGECAPNLSRVHFSGGTDGGNALYFADKATPTVRDCTIDDGGTEKFPAIFVSSGAGAEITDCTVSGDRSVPVYVDEAPSVVFERLRTFGGRVDRYAVDIRGGSAVTLTDCAISDASGTALGSAESTLQVSGLHVTDPGKTAVFVSGGVITADGVRIRRPRWNALSLQNTRAELTDMEIEGTGRSPEDDICPSVYLEKTRLTASGLRILSVKDVYALKTTESTATLRSFTVDGAAVAALFTEDSTVDAADVDIRACTQTGVAVYSGSYAAISDAGIDGCGGDGVQVGDGARLSLKNASITRSSGSGIGLLKKANATVEGTTVSESGNAAVIVLVSARLRMVDCTVTGNHAKGLHEEDGAVVQLTDTEFLDRKSVV